MLSQRDPIKENISIVRVIVKDVNVFCSLFALTGTLKSCKRLLSINRDRGEKTMELYLICYSTLNEKHFSSI